MLYKLVNGLLPEVMNELYTTTDQIHDHFTRKYQVSILIKDVPTSTQEALVI